MSINYSKKTKGAISVWLLLVFGVVLSLLVTLINSTRSASIQLQLECAMDMGLYSVFAEYNRAVYDRFGLFFIDTTYGTDTSSYHYTENHLLDYIEYNLEPDKDMTVLGLTDLYKIQTNLVKFTQIELATDDGYMSMKQQGIRYIKDKYGGNVVNWVKDSLDSIEDQEAMRTEADSMLDKAVEEFTNIEENGIQVSEDEWIEMTFENPAERVKKNRYKGILELVIKDKSNLSQNAVNTGLYCSHRNRNSGTGNMDKCEFSFIDDLMFNEYCMDSFSNYMNPDAEGLLQYQIEYLLFGYQSDIENLKAAANRIILLREGVNLTCLMSDGTKMSEISALAGSISAALLAPYLAPLLEIAMAAAWAYAESIYEMKLLFAGHKLPLVKTGSDWNVSFSGLGNYVLDEISTEVNKTDDETGLDYAAYLRILLGLTKQKTILARTADLMEMIIKLTEGNRFFRMDACITGVTASLEVTSSFGDNYSMKRKYRY